MATNVSSLWPAEFGEVQVLTPIAILREQGFALGEMTKNIVVGRVSTHAVAEGFRQDFMLYCGPLGYATPLLSVDHGIELYPARVHFSLEPGEPSVVHNPEDFKEELKEIFANEKTKKIIQSLLAQSKQ